MSDTAGISILIPIYNYPVYSLVKSISEQALDLNIPYEILCYDDGSTHQEVKKTNAQITVLQGVIYKELPQNIGRSKIRNKLAQESAYSILLFMDCDSKVFTENFLKEYLEHAATNPVILGGTVYNQPWNPECSLRLKYGKKREQRDAARRMRSPYHHINLNNIMVQKTVYLQCKLDERISTYGHEDTKFGYALKEKQIPVLHIDNPVEHCGLESNSVFIKKTHEAIKNFYTIIQEGYGLDTKLFKTYSLLKKLKLYYFFILYYNFFQKHIEKNLLSSHPSLFYFDLFKLKILLEQGIR